MSEDIGKENESHETNKENHVEMTTIEQLAAGAILAAAMGFAGAGSEYECLLRNIVPTPASEYYESEADYLTTRHQCVSACEDDRTPIIIALNATRTKACGILSLPQTKAIYFYSIDWSDVFKFPDESEEFAMTNAAIGLTVFKKYVNDYRFQEGQSENYDTPVNFKCTHKFWKARHEQQQIKWKDVRKYVEEMLGSTPFQGSLYEEDLAKNDPHIKVAEKLSRENLGEERPISNLFKTDANDAFVQYEQFVRISEIECKVAVDQVRLQMPLSVSVVVEEKPQDLDFYH